MRYGFVFTFALVWLICTGVSGKVAPEVVWAPPVILLAITLACDDALNPRRRPMARDEEEWR